MTGRISGKGRRKVGPVQIACWRSKRTEVWISEGHRIPVAFPRGSCPSIGLPNTRHWAPKIIVVLRFPNRDASIGHRRIHQGQKTSKLDHIYAHLLGGLSDHLLIEPRRRTEPGSTIVGPKDSNPGLFVRSHGRCNDTVAAKLLHFIERRRIVRTIQSRRGWNPKLFCRFHNKWLDPTPIRAESKRNLADWILAPFSRLIAGYVVHVDAWLGMLRTIVCAEFEDGRRRAAPEIQSIILCLSARNELQIFGKGRGKILRLRRKKSAQSIVCRLRDGGIHRGFFRCRRNSGVASIAAADRNHGVEDGDVHNRHRATRTPGTKLFSKDSGLALGHGRMIQTAGIDRNLVPATNSIYTCILTARLLAVAWRSLEA